MKTGGLLLFILEFFCFLPLASLADQDIQARFETSLKNARSITNVEIQIVDTLWIKQLALSKDPKSAISGFSRTVQYSYAASGQKYRAECQQVSASLRKTTNLFQVAFDGTTSFSYTPDNRYLTRKNGNSRGDNAEAPVNPLIAPFMFLTRQTDGCINCVLRFTDILSSAFANGLILPEGQRSDRLLEIDMPGLPLSKQPTFWKIFLDQKGDSFTPKTIRFVGAGVETVYELLDYTNLGAYQFPSAIAWSSTTYPATSPATLLSTGLVTTIAVRVPEKIPDSMFMLDENLAATIWDGDQHTLVKTSSKLATIRARNGTARNVLLLMLLFTAVIIPIVVAKRFASKNK